MMVIKGISAVFVGHVFKLINRRLNRTWRGSLDAVCDQLMTEGLDVPTMWGDVDTQVSVVVATCPPSAIIGKKHSARIESVLRRLPPVSSPAGESNVKAMAAAIKGFDLDEQKSLTRFLFVAGLVKAIGTLGLEGLVDPSAEDEIGMTLPGWACAFGSLKSLQWQDGPKWSVEHANSFCWNYLDLAERNRRPEVASYLVGLGAKPRGESLRVAMRKYGIPFKTSANSKPGVFDKNLQRDALTD